jgi:hypothetical protein
MKGVNIQPESSRGNVQWPMARKQLMASGENVGGIYLINVYISCEINENISKAGVSIAIVIGVAINGMVTAVWRIGCLAYRPGWPRRG